MADTKDPKPLFATPAEAVACAKKYIEDYTDCHDPDWQRARAALESLEAEVGRLAKMLDVCSVVHDHNVKLKERTAALESELAEKTARVAWREPSAAIDKARVLFVVKPNTVPVVCIGGWDEAQGCWLDEDTDAQNDRLEWSPHQVLAWLPLDSLPAIPSEPVKP
jgi:hypothetical protein